MPEDRELQNGIMAYGVSNVIGALFGGLPTATYSQNVGIVTTTKVINRCVLGLAAVILGVAGIVPKFSALLTTIPQCVLGGATVSVFASIAMTGMKLVASAEMDYRNSSIVGLAAAIGVGVSQASAALASFPDWVTTIFGKSPVVLATLIAVVLNIILPKSRVEQKEEEKLKEEVKEKIKQDHEEFDQGIRKENPPPITEYISVVGRGFFYYYSKNNGFICGIQMPEVHPLQEEPQYFPGSADGHSG